MLTLTDPCCTLKLLRWRWVIKVETLDKLSVCRFHCHCTERSPTPYLSGMFPSCQFDCQFCFFSVSGNKLQNPPLVIPCIFHWMWHNRLFLSFHLYPSSSGWLVWLMRSLFLFTSYLQLDAAEILLIFSEICLVTHGSHPLYMHIYLQNDAAWVKLCSSHRGWKLSCHWPGSDHRWFAASYEYADIKTRGETVNLEEQGRQETCSDDNRITVTRC